MSAASCVIDVTRSGAAARGLVVLVEPLYGGPALAAALDAGWRSVELEDELAGVAPIPLVSYEQQPPVEAASDRCRVRAADLFDAAGAVLGAGRTVVVGSPALARPLASRIALELGDGEAVTFVAVSSRAEAGDNECLSADAWWACGMLIRVLLEELDDRPSRLTDAAGMSVAIARGAERPAELLGTGLRWRRHLARGGNADDLRVASAIDTLAVIPSLVAENDALVARGWAFDHSGS